MQNPAIDCIWPLKGLLLEGPLWDEGRKGVWFVDIKAQKIYFYDVMNGNHQSFDTPLQVGFVVLASDHKLIAGMQDGLYLFDPINKSFEFLGDPEPDYPGNRLNDGTVDSEGRLWFGSMHDEMTDTSGALYCYSDGAFTKADDGYIITNGPCLSPCGKRLYHVDSVKRLIYVFDVIGAGKLDNKQVFIDLSHQSADVDGIVCDGDGSIWASLFGGGAILVYDKDAKLSRTIPMPVSNITKIAFGGEDLKTVYVTTSSLALNEDEIKAQPLAGSLFCFRNDVSGLLSFQVK